MTLWKRIYIAAILILTVNMVSGQDLTFSQFFANRLYLNPAYVGHPKHHRTRMVFRNQWLTRESPYMSYGVSYDRFYINQNSGVGINIVNDMQGFGSLNWLTADILYSYTIQVAYNAQLRGGIQAGGIFKSQNTSNLVFPDMIDPTGEIVGTPGFAGDSKLMPDFAAGIVGEWGIVYGGFAAHHLAEPIDSETNGDKINLSRKYTGHIGCNINLYKRYLFRKSLTLSPNVIYQQQGNFHQINIGTYISHQYFVAGLWLRENLGFSSHTFIFVAGYHDDKYSISYSYDFSLLEGGFRGLNTSSHEVTFGMNFQYKERSRKKIRPIKSPKF